VGEWEPTSLAGSARVSAEAWESAWAEALA
jgi:hypothetical protein